MHSANLRKKVAHYSLIRQLGKGGMGEVFLATDEILQRAVAIKLLPLDNQSNEDLRARFMNEARVAASLNHPNIVTIYEFGETKDEPENSKSPINGQQHTSLLYLVMEHLEGQSLSEILDGRRLSPHEATIYAMQLAEGLHAAHKQNIIHRDIKPSNIMITLDSRVKILDFGLSKLVHEDSSDSSARRKQTTKGVLVGTVPYLSPERAFGQKLDTRSDIFSFGIVLFELLTDQHPFQGLNETETLARLTSRDPHPWPESLNLPGLLKALVMKCLQKEPGHRYSSLAQVLTDLETVKRELQSTGKLMHKQTERVSTHESPPTLQFDEPEQARRSQTLTEGDIEALSIGDAITAITPEVTRTEAREISTASNEIIIESPKDKVPVTETRSIIPPTGRAMEITRETPLKLELKPEEHREIARGSRTLTAIGRLAQRPVAKPIMVASLVAIAIIVALVIQQQQHGNTIDKFKSVQVTASAGLDIYPSFSFDGRSIAYSSDRSNGNFEIYIKQLTPGGREIQLTKDGGQNLQPAWSPNGELIAYYSMKRGGIWVMPALGGQPRQLSEFGSRPAWSPDGKYITFQSDALNDLAAATSVALPPSTIWQVPLSGGEARSLTKAGNPAGGHGAPSYSIDGKRIYFVTSDRINSDIYSISLDATGDNSSANPPQRVVANQNFNYDPICTPDGKNLFFFSISKNWDYGMWRIALNPENGEAQGEPVLIANLGLNALRQLAISSDGKKLAYSALSTTSNLHTISISLTSQEALDKPRSLTNEVDRNSRPAFSPDGNKIAYDKWRLGTNPDIWVMDANGNNTSQVTTDSGYDTLPSWFPHSDRIAFLSNRNGHWAIWSATLSSGRETLFDDFGQDTEFARLSPDGTMLAFNSKKDSNTINTWLSNISNKKVKQLTFDKELMAFPCWSPDGKFLAMQVKRGEDRHIAVLDVKSGAIEQLPTSAGQSWSDSWSPDSDKIAFAGKRNGFWNVWWISRSTKVEKQLTNYDKLTSYVRYPAWSPRGDQIVYEYAETKGNIWMIDNLK